MKFKVPYINPITIIGIPILSMGICLFASKDNEMGGSFLEQYLITCIYTGIIWSTNEMVFNYYKWRFPNLADTKYRILYQSITSIAVTFADYLLATCITLLLRGKALSIQDCLSLESLKITFIATALVTILFESIYFFEKWKFAVIETERLQKETALAQFETLKSQINPHFLFNTLNTLVAIIPDQPQKAVDFVQKLSYVFRYVLSMRDMELVKMEDEIQFIQSYLFLLKVRYGNNLHIHQQDFTPIFDKYLPPVCTQLLIENAIKHNVISKDKNLDLYLSHDHEYVIIKNTLQEKIHKEESTGLGLDNIIKRYSFLASKKVVVEKTETDFVVKLPLISL